jgi:hypothetical protein
MSLYIILAIIALAITAFIWAALTAPIGIETEDGLHLVGRDEGGG